MERDELLKHAFTLEELCQIKLNQSSKKKDAAEAEEYAYKLLTALKCPIVTKIDGQDKYKYLEDGLLKPDFIVGSRSFGENRPKDFYVDVQCITGGPWDITSKSNPYFENGSAPRNIWKSNAPYEVVDKAPKKNFYGDEQALKDAVWSTFSKKTQKYGLERNSPRFGLVSIAQSSEIDSLMHLGNIVSDICHTLQRHVGNNDFAFNKIADLQMEFLTKQKTGVIPIVAPFDKDYWCFWIITSRYFPYGNCLFIVNTTGVSRSVKEFGNSPVTNWLKQIHTMQGYDYFNKID
ncbi:hypothetical protein J3455_08605 [Pseudoalteromonas sp. NFXS39]|uniref:hypothetical protein n=1 Tax=Pseudoalteromonas sp. NFXS39 TaxID=2818437 RepID=UPI0032DE9266